MKRFIVLAILAPALTGCVITRSSSPRSAGSRQTPSRPVAHRTVSAPSPSPSVAIAATPAPVERASAALVLGYKRNTMFLYEDVKRAFRERGWKLTAEEPSGFMNFSLSAVQGEASAQVDASYRKSADGHRTFVTIVVTDARGGGELVQGLHDAIGRRAGERGMP